jgi:putative SOS response-associated peptidase YedK
LTPNLTKPAREAESVACATSSITKGPQAIRDFTHAMHGDVGNTPPLPGVFPDYFAPIVRNSAEGRELVRVRWGMPSPFDILKGKNRDTGVTNIRNVSSPHWRRWLGVENRCVVPFSSFSENEVMPDGSRPPVWFAFDETRPLAFFAGLWTRWTSIRKVKEGETTNDVYGFLTGLGEQTDYVRDSMIKIYVSAEAYRAITKSLPKGTKAYPAEQETSGMALWLDPDTHAALRQARLKSESFSETILRLVKTEEAEAVRTIRPASAANPLPANTAPASKSKGTVKRNPNQRELLFPIVGSRPPRELAKQAKRPNVGDKAG